MNNGPAPAAITACFNIGRVNLWPPKDPNGSEATYIVGWLESSSKYSQCDWTYLESLLSIQFGALISWSRPCSQQHHFSAFPIQFYHRSRRRKRTGKKAGGINQIASRPAAAIFYPKRRDTRTRRRTYEMRLRFVLLRPPLISLTVKEIEEFSADRHTDRLSSLSLSLSFWLLMNRFRPFSN